VKKSFNIQDNHSTSQVQTPWNQANAPLLQRDKESDLKHPSLVDLIRTNKTNKLPCFVDRLWLALLHCFSICFHFECGHSFACSYVLIPHSKIYCQTSLDFFNSCLQWSPHSFFIHWFLEAFIWALHSICFWHILLLVLWEIAFSIVFLTKNPLQLKIWWV